MDKIDLGTCSNIIPFREKLREAAKNVKLGGVTTFKFSVRDDENVVRTLIEETGLEFRRG